MIPTLFRGEDHDEIANNYCGTIGAWFRKSRLSTYMNVVKTSAQYAIHFTSIFHIHVDRCILSTPSKRSLGKYDAI